MPNTVTGFQNFVDGWLTRQTQFVEQLTLAVENTNTNTNEDRQNLISQVLDHYHQYYARKLLAARNNVKIFFSPPWLSSYETALLWMGGFNPSTVMNLVRKSITDLTADQQEKINSLAVEVKNLERQLTSSLATLQESVAAPPLCNLLRRFRSPSDAQTAELAREMTVMDTALLRLLEEADVIRFSTLSDVVAALNPVQAIKALAAIGEFQMNVRRSGQRIDNEGIGALAA